MSAPLVSSEKSPNQAPLGYEEKRVGEIIDQLPKNVGLKYNDLSNYIKTNKPTLVNSTVDFRYFNNKHFSSMTKYGPVLPKIFIAQQRQMVTQCILSLAEQDLAFRASVFVGSSQSEWAKMISIDRFETIPNSKIECSILEYMVNAKAIGFEFDFF